MPRSLLVVALVCAMAGTAAPAAADEPSESVVEAARTDFAEGQAHFRTKHWSEALKSFERSYDRVPSPNAQLMIARCLRELGRGPEAAAAFSSAETEARRRVTKGENKYADTADAALSEGNAVRAGLGTMKIHVVRSSGATLSIDRKTVALSRDGDATVFHEPGSAQVAVRDSTGAEQRQTVTVTAGNTAEMEFVVAEPRPAAPPLATQPLPPKREAHDEHEGKHYPSWLLPATIAAGGITLAATGLGVGFGASSKATFEKLVARCGIACPESSRPEADAGARAQTIANISYGVAIAGVVATAVILYLGLTSGTAKAN